MKHENIKDAALRAGYTLQLMPEHVLETVVDVAAGHNTTQKLERWRGISRQAARRRMAKAQQLGLIEVGPPGSAVTLVLTTDGRHLAEGIEAKGLDIPERLKVPTRNLTGLDEAAEAAEAAELEAAEAWEEVERQLAQLPPISVEVRMGLSCRVEVVPRRDVDGFPAVGEVVVACTPEIPTVAEVEAVLRDDDFKRAKFDAAAEEVLPEVERLESADAMEVGHE